MKTKQNLKAVSIEAAFFWTLVKMKKMSF